jgi:hypothetical protein
MHELVAEMRRAIEMLGVLAAEHPGRESVYRAWMRHLAHDCHSLNLLAQIED